MNRILLVPILMSIFACRETYERQIVLNDKLIATIFEADGKQGLKDTLGHILLEPRFDYIEDFVECGVIKVDSGGREFHQDDLVGYQMNKVGLIDYNGNVLARPQFDEITFNWFPLGLVKRDNRYGFINNRGQIRIPIHYLHAAPFQNGFAVVKTKTGYGLIDSTNTFIIKPDKDSLDLSYATGFSKDTMLIVINNYEKMLMINSEGETFEVIERKTKQNND